MQLITKLIILAFYLATITKATPHGFLFSGKELAGASVGCPRWKINYALINESGNQNGTGYFTVEKCFGSAQHVGDGIFDLDLDMATHSAVLTEKSTSSKLQGKLDRKLPHALHWQERKNMSPIFWNQR